MYVYNITEVKVSFAIHFLHIGILISPLWRECGLPVNMSY